MKNTNNAVSSIGKKIEQGKGTKRDIYRIFQYCVSTPRTLPQKYADSSTLLSAKTKIMEILSRWVKEKNITGLTPKKYIDNGIYLSKDSCMLEIENMGWVVNKITVFLDDNEYGKI